MSDHLSARRGNAAGRFFGRAACSDMRLRVCTWNINSIRPRADQVARFVAEQAPDVVCLQEIKCLDGQFPHDALKAAGLSHVRIAGQKGLHGVAIASRLPLQPGPALDVCRHGEARHVSAIVAGVEVHNLYIPAGGDLPDRFSNPKFDHKLDVFERLTGALAARGPDAPILLVGDLNVAPGEHDVWNHRYMSRIVSHTPQERAAMARLRESLQFVDLVRAATPAPTKAFTWWSYRARDFRASNRGLRLDHLWAAPALARHAMGARIHDDVRGWERPSDHVPVTCDLLL